MSETHSQPASGTVAYEDALASFNPADVPSGKLQRFILRNAEAAKGP